MLRCVIMLIISAKELLLVRGEEDLFSMINISATSVFYTCVEPQLRINLKLNGI